MSLTQLTDLQPTNIKVTGIATFDQTVGIAGTLTYEDVTNIDSVGVITARSGIRVTGGNAVIGGTTPATAGQTQLTLRDNGQVGLSLLCGAIQNATITFGGVADGYSSSPSGFDDGKIMYDNSSNHMQFNTAGGERLRITSDGDIYTSGNAVRDDARLTIEKNKVGVSTAIHLHNSNGSGTASKISASKGLILSADVENNTNADRSFISFHTDNSERLSINSNGHLGLNVTPGSWDNTFKALEGGGNSKHGELFFQANGDWTTALGCNLYFNAGWKYRHAGAANWFEMKEDRTTFYMADSGSADSAITWLERFRIHSPGYITKPYQVAFFAYCNINNHDLGGGDKFQFNALPSSGKASVNSNHTTFNGTNVFNTSTNTFTAPVAGLYYFHINVYFNRANDPLTSLVARVNNTEVTNGSNTVFFVSHNTVVSGNSFSGSMMLQLAANDAVTVHRRSNNTGTTRFYGPHCHFCGHLIG